MFAQPAAVQLVVPGADEVEEAVIVVVAPDPGAFELGDQGELPLVIAPDVLVLMQVDPAVVVEITPGRVVAVHFAEPDLFGHIVEAQRLWSCCRKECNGVQDGE